MITLNISCHSFLACRVFVERSVDSLTGVLLYFFPRELISLSICCKAGLVVLNSLSFCLSVKFLSLCQIGMRTLLGILDCRFSPFVTLNISCHSLLACRIFAQKSAFGDGDSLICYLLFFPCCFKYFFFVFNFC